MELVENEYFITEENVGMLKLAKEANTIVVRCVNLNYYKLNLFFNKIKKENNFSRAHVILIDLVSLKKNWFKKKIVIKSYLWV